MSRSNWLYDLEAAEAYEARMDEPPASEVEYPSPGEVYEEEREYARWWSAWSQRQGRLDV